MKQIFIQHLPGTRHYSMFLSIGINKLEKCPFRKVDMGAGAGDKKVKIYIYSISDDNKYIGGEKEKKLR